MGDGPLIAYSVKQTAENLQVNPETVRRWIRAGLPALNVGGVDRPDYRIEPAKLREWLEHRPVIGEHDEGEPKP